MTHTLIVGGGAAGSALASRLSEDPRRAVTLLEAGNAAPTPDELRDGGTMPAVSPAHAANWAYAAELFPGAPTVVPRGRILGGSTTINGGYFERARPEDFARWAQVGGSRWEFAATLPLLAALERDVDFGSEPGHGSTGPMPVARPALDDPLSAAFVSAARELGFPAESDKNAPHSVPGIGPVPSNIVNGVRVNSASAYLDAARNRPNLRIVGDTRVLRVRIAANRATGVETTTGDYAADEVVLCAGGVATPQLLLLSGIGPAAQLRQFGIPLVADLPVGTTFSDHPNVAVGWHPRHSLHDLRQRYAFPAALNVDSSGAARRHPEGDLEILLGVKPFAELFAGATNKGPNEVAEGRPNEVPDAVQRPGAAALQLLVALQRPRSRGSLTLRNTDPLEPPRIDYGYLKDADDRARLRLGVRTAAALLQSRAFNALFDRFDSVDDSTLGSDEEIDVWVRAHLGTAIHLSGSAPIGPVLDPGGRVHGVAGLCVADTSMLPEVPSRGPSNTAVFIGEFMARQLRTA